MSLTIASLDRWFPPRGPCAFCGGPDARHRLWDMLILSPESDRDLASWYDLPIEAVQAVRDVRPYQAIQSDSPDETERKR